MRIRILPIWLVIGLASAVCHASSRDVGRSVNFVEVDWFAKRARAAYETEAAIRQAFPNTVRVTSVPNTDVQYFLERDVAKKLQVITIRGTANLANLREDAEFTTEVNPHLGIYVHSGFDRDAFKLYEDVLPYLDKANPVRVTGHSLGAAISTLLMMYLHKDGFQLQRSINFGQPKLTNSAGAQAYKFLPLLRVVDKKDLVPQLPPSSWVDFTHGSYRHFGREVILLERAYYVYLAQHQAMNDSKLSSFWYNLDEESLNDHRIANYLSNITPKLIYAEPVAYSDRERFLAADI